MYSRSLRHAVLATALAACGSEEMFQLELATTEQPVSAVAVAQIASDNRALGAPVVVGDLDGDGSVDAIMIGRGYDSEPQQSLVSDAYVIYGGSAVTGSIAVDTLPHLSELDVVPQIVRVGDVDGDGLADFLVVVVTAGSQPHPTPHGTYLVYGRATRFAGATRLRDAAVLLGGGTSPDIWPTVVGLGDVDGDGRDDFALGAQIGADHAATIFLFYGRAERFAGAVDVPTGADAGITVPAGEVAAGEGVEVSGLGDIDGDGRPDFLVGASLVRGRTARLAGTVALGDISTTRFAAAAGPRGVPGRGVALGDLDGDGLDDFALRSDGSLTGASWMEGYQLYYGRAGGFSPSVEASAADATVTSSGTISIAAIADGKGHRDLVVGDPALHDDNGALHVVRGNGARLAGMIDLSHTTTYVGVPRHAENCEFATHPDCSIHEGLGQSVASAAITGGDRPDLLVGTTGSPPSLAVPGSSYARLYVVPSPAAP